MTLLQVVASILGSALLFKFAVFIFSPESENSLLRALTTGVSVLGALVVADVLPKFGAAPWVSTAVFFVAPLVIIKIAYELSLFRSLLVSGLFLALYTVISHLSLLRVVRFEVGEDSTQTAPQKRAKPMK